TTLTSIHEKDTAPGSRRRHLCHPAWSYSYVHRSGVLPTPARGTPARVTRVVRPRKRGVEHEEPTPKPTPEPTPEPTKPTRKPRGTRDARTHAPDERAPARTPRPAGRRRAPPRPQPA